MNSDQIVGAITSESDASFRSMPNPSRPAQDLSFAREFRCGRPSEVHWEDIPLDKKANKRMDSAPIHSNRDFGENSFGGLSHNRFKDNRVRGEIKLSLDTMLQKSRSDPKVSNEIKPGHGQVVGTEHAQVIDTVHSKPILASEALVSGPVSSLSVMSSVCSLDPCGHIPVGPHQPPNPSDLNDARPVKFRTLLHEPVGNYMNERLVGFRPSPSQHNIEDSLNWRHPYQTLPEPKSWTSRFYSWFGSSPPPETRSQSWPQPITLGVSELVNQSSSSFLPRSSTEPIPMSENPEPIYTAQPLPLAPEKQQTILPSPRGVFMCC